MLAVAATLIAVHVALAWIGRSPGLLTGQDDTTYVLLGRALREHLAYREIFEPGAPLHGKYPPFFPAVLALWTGLFGETWRALSALGVLVSASTLVLVFDAVRRTAGPALALGSLAALAVNPYLVLRAGTAWSEPLFALLTVLAVWALSRGEGRRHAWLAGAAAVAAAMTRLVGVTLIAALVAHWALERRWRRAAAMAGAGLATAGAWIGWSVHVGLRGSGGDSYLHDLPVGGGGAPRSAAGGADVGAAPGAAEGLVDGGQALWSLVIDGATGAVRYVTLGLDWRLPLPHVPGTPVDNVLTAGVIVVGLVAGLALWLWRTWRPAGLYLAVFLGFLAIYPVQIGRLLEPLLPLAVPTVLVGVTALAWRWIGRRTALAAALLLPLTVAVTGATRGLPRVMERADCSAVSLEGGGRDCMTPAQRGYFDALAFVDRRTPRDALFLSAKPEPLYYYTGRRGIDDRGALRIPDDSLYRHLDRQGVDHVLLGHVRWIERGRFLPALQRECGRLSPLASFDPSTHLFRLLPAGSDTAAAGGAGGAGGCDVLEDYREATAGREFPDEVLY